VLATWNRFRRKLKRAGLEVPPTRGPLDLGCAAMRRFPRQARAIQGIVDLYIELRYGAGYTPEEASRLRREVRRLKLHKGAL